MFFVSIIFLTILIPSIQSLKPTLKLKFSPDEKYYTHGYTVNITCEVLNPTTDTGTAQLWHVDLATGNRTAITPSLIDSPGEDSPLIFKHNTNKRIQYLRKNYLRIRNLQLEDSARYECDCPDCSEELGTVNKTLQVMKTTEPKWSIKSNWTLQAGVETTIKCTADDFYPYVGYQIIRHQHDISKIARAVAIPKDNVYPDQFSWRANVTPMADWHQTLLVCIVIQGNTEQRAEKYLKVLFTPRFEKCDEKQHVNSTHEKATIECTYSGNPEPGLTWYRQNDNNPLMSENGIHIETKAHNHGRYTSMITFDRDILVNTSTTTTTKAPADSTTQSKVIGDNYYEQLLNGGFTVKFTDINNEESISRNITIVRDAKDVQSKSTKNSAIQNLSTFIILFSALFIL